MNKNRQEICQIKSVQEPLIECVNSPTSLFSLLLLATRLLVFALCPPEGSMHKEDDINC